MVIHPFSPFHDPSTFYWYLRFVVVAGFLIAALPLVVKAKWNAWRRVELSVFAFALVLFASTAIAPDSFATIHITYALLVCVVPALAIVLVIASRRRYRISRFWQVLTIIFLCVLPAGLGVYGTDVEPNHLHVTHDRVPSAKLSADQHLRIALLADIQSPRVTDYETGAVNKVNAQKPDLILYAGDFFSAENNPFPQHFDEFVNLAKQFEPHYGTVFVNGDHDDRNLESVLSAAHQRLLNDEVATFKVRGATVGVLGISNSMDEKGRLAIQQFAKRTDLQFKIVLAHHPDVIFAVPAGIDLVATGHTHGGQVRVPFFGPVMTLTDVPRNQAGGGLFDYSENRRLLITRGVGYEHGYAPKLRLNDPPEINVIDVNYK